MVLVWWVLFWLWFGIVGMVYVVSLQVVLILLQFIFGQNVDVLWVSNSGILLVDVQVCVFCWMQCDGKDVFEFIIELVVSLLMQLLVVGQQQLIWVVCVQLEVFVVQFVYWVIVDEVLMFDLVCWGMQFVLCYLLLVFVQLVGG